MVSSPECDEFAEGLGIGSSILSVLPVIVSLDVEVT